jgi:hypothetical protein
MPLIGTESILAGQLLIAVNSSGTDRLTILTAISKAIIDHIVANGQVAVVGVTTGPGAAVGTIT